MSEANKAVFLSYTSQDAGAAKRICEALRDGGIEVWLDQSELRGGDAWDQKIRQQIRDCALFIPLISANTASRHEGYFRLEWDLADQRTHKIARNRPFIFPVCLDATPDAGADVPDSFLRVQWTRLPAGETPAAFVDRISELLSPGHASRPASGRPSAGSADAGERHVPHPAASTRGKAWPALITLAIAVMGVCYLAVDKFVLSKRPLAVAATPIAPPDEAAPGPAPAAADGKSIAVLPFADLSEKKDQEYFSDGLAEELRDLLAKTPGLHVIARTSSFSFKGTSEDIPTIARKLNVANILEGSVRKSGNRLRVTTQLIRARSGEDFWSETYDRELKDVFQVQDEISGAVVAALKVSLLGAAPSRATPTANTEAYMFFLKCTEAGRFEARQSIQSAITYCRQAVALDPNFAPAWVQLGDAIRLQFVGFSSSPYEEARPAAYAAVQRALALDPKQAKAHQALAAIYYQMDFDPASAAVEMQRAVELDPANAGIYWARGYIASIQGRFGEAMQNLQRARDLDPLDTDVYIQIGDANYRAGSLAEAAAAYRAAIALQPAIGSVHYRLGLVSLRQNDPAGALAEMIQEPDSDFHAVGLPLALDALGRRGEADAAVADAERASASGAAYQIALIYAARHDADRAFLWLDRAYRQRDTGLLWMKADPVLEGLRTDPRFPALLHKMHLD
jgi:TolB-like protein/tetratricopeptide (TPR) repeat protein